MKQFSPAKYSTQTILQTVGILVLLLLALALVLIGNQNSHQSVMPLLADVSFQGEYRIADGDWHPIEHGEHISSTRGDVMLRGIFMLHDPIDGAPIAPISPGTEIALYCNHLRCTVILPNGQEYCLDAENEYYGEDACAIQWGSYAPESADAVTIVLHNPHRFGNELAVDQFLENLSIAPGTHLESIMLRQGSTERNIGLLILIFSLLILGIAFFSSVVHIRYNYTKQMWLIGLMIFFAGGYFLFSAFGVNFWSPSHILNTRARGICMMLYVFFTSALVTTLLRARPKRLARIATAVSGGTALCCMLLAFHPSVRFFDTWALWALVTVPIVLTLAACLLCSLKGSSPAQKFLYPIGSLALLALPIDLLSAKFGWWEGGMISKHIFLAIFLTTLVVVMRIIPSHINTAITAQQLESEQQALRLELQESRISIMLSQMQPHFIFNTLNTIYHLCEIDPEVARRTVSTFSEYLRNNIDNLGRSEMISFEKELSFVKTYLDIEKIRFDDELELIFDIGVTNFKLPVLTVQPLVENAVKHGTSKKEGVSQLRLSTVETDTAYEITVSDTGVGFDPNAYVNDGHRHIGISSVRQRLAHLCNGTLSIQSEQGVGTCATVRIPKKEETKS